jgi:protein-L-isoaspartate(D-aspartate) O-methyltransferase
MNNSNNDLVAEIQEKAESYLTSGKRSDAVLEAMRATNRSQFVPFPDEYIYEDIPLPIGHGQTCSQPSMVVFMLDMLEIKKGMRVLEIGAGCGYAAATASHLVGEHGKIFACEAVHPLYELLQRNTILYRNITPIYADGSSGIHEYAPYDRIFLSAGVGAFLFDENTFIHDLCVGGILLYPEISGNIYKVRKNGSAAHKESFFGVRFVPLIKGIKTEE